MVPNDNRSPTKKRRTKKQKFNNKHVLRHARVKSKTNELEICNEGFYYLEIVIYSMTNKHNI